jgi:hypothetical protein
MSGTIFIDGGPPRGLPLASAVSSTDGIVVAQGGTPGVPGTATVREATIAQVIASAGLLPIAGGTITGNLTVNGTTTLTGTPTGPTALPGTATVQLATTAFDTAAVLVETNRALAVEALKAPLASPAFTGIPTVPTAPLGTNTTQAASTAFTSAAIAAALFAPASAPGLIFGLTLSNDGVTPNTVLDVASGTCTDSTNSHAIALGAFTKSIAGSWAAGIGANGMGIGLTATLNTWYHVFAIIVSGASDVYFDTSVTAANKPASTTAFRRIGSIFLDASVHFVRFAQNGDRFYLSTPSVPFSGTPGVTTAQTLVVASPPGIVTEAILSGVINDPTSSNSSMYLSSLALADLPAGTGLTAASGGIGLFSSWNVIVTTNTSSQIRQRVSTTTLSITIQSNGWIDTRGK